MPLVPELRTDRNGRTQRRWVRAGSSAAPGRTPPPAAALAPDEGAEEAQLGWDAEVPDYLYDTIRELPASLAHTIMALCAADSRSEWLTHGVNRILVNNRIDATERPDCLEVLVAHHESALEYEGSEAQALAALFGLRVVERDITGPLGWERGEAALAVLCAHRNGARTGGWRRAGDLHGMMAIVPAEKTAALIPIAVRHPREAARIVELSDEGLNAAQIAAVLDDGAPLPLADGIL